MYNTVTNDAETQRRSMLYENQMDQFSRFEINLLCTANNIPYDPKTSPKVELIAALKRQNVQVPTREGINALIEQHREKVRAAKEEVKIDYKSEEVEAEKDVSEMSMSELRSLAKAKGINSYGKKKTDLIEALSGPDAPADHE